jgi:hypothetical protein
MATIAAMPKRLRPILLALTVVGASTGLLGCGDNGGPAASIPAESAQTLEAKIAEIKANVDVGSCLVASDKTDDLIADVQALPSGVNQDVRAALENGANQLKLLLADPSQCQSRATTSETPTTTPSTTQETTTTRTRPTTTTTPTQTEPNTITTPTQTQTTPTTGGSGGIGPGGL